MLPLCYSLQLLLGHILQGAAEAMLNTARFDPPTKPVDTEITFPGHFLCLIIDHGSIGAGVDAELASVTFLFIQKDGAIFSLYDRVDRTGSHTQRVITVDAQGRKEIEVELILNLSRFDGHHPAPLRTGLIGKVVLLPAGNLAGMTADTTVEYD